MMVIVTYRIMEIIEMKMKLKVYGDHTSFRELAQMIVFAVLAWKKGSFSKS